MSVEPIVVHCCGRLTISEASDLRQTILEAFATHSDIVLDCSDATEVDLTFVQLLICSRRAAAGAGSLRIAAPIEAAVADSLRRAGFSAEEFLTL
jgi:anti-anti-sigma regulatory factor